jgi:alpha-ketoglutarate-dependent dioxygenase FTO
MGKNRKRKQRQSLDAPPPPKERGHPSSSASSINKNASNLLPLLFPSALRRPSNDFLRDEGPYKESFQVALKTAYEGFVVDNSVGKEQVVARYLEQIVKNKYLRRDVTQPFGLGTKCAKTYVTRCLMGEPGTTYKYLGLRMFAHPWERTEIEALGATLTQRARQHLQTLSEKRSRRNAPRTKGRADFDICLINRMEARDDLKSEPTIGNAKATVSWHADSSLEHYSTIAVYQTLVPPKKQTNIIQCNDSQEKWFVALRVAHNSEGPQSSRRGTDIESSIVKEAPPIAASLPSGSAYYLLDDFNHHHQHTVLTNGDLASAGVRYSCTFRLLRESHNVDHMIARCQAACSNFHKKGSKLWRSEQLLLTELESEWIRQFYIQGSQHHDLLWPVSLGLAEVAVPTLCG